MRRRESFNLLHFKKRLNTPKLQVSHLAIDRRKYGQIDYSLYSIPVSVIILVIFAE